MKNVIKEYSYYGSIKSGGNRTLSNGLKSNSCCAEIYIKDDDFRVYFGNRIYKSDLKNIDNEIITETNSDLKLLFKISKENGINRTLIGFVFDSQDWLNELPIKYMKTMQEYMDLDKCGVLDCVEEIDEIILNL